VDAHDLITPKRKLSFTGEDQEKNSEPKTAQPNKTRVNLQKFRKDGPQEPCHELMSNITSADWETGEDSPEEDNREPRLVRRSSKGPEEKRAAVVMDTKNAKLQRAHRLPSTSDTDRDWKEMMHNFKNGLEDQVEHDEQGDQEAEEPTLEYEDKGKTNACDKGGQGNQTTKETHQEPKAKNKVKQPTMPATEQPDDESEEGEVGKYSASSNGPKETTPKEAGPKKRKKADEKAEEQKRKKAAPKKQDATVPEEVEENKVTRKRAKECADPEPAPEESKKPKKKAAQQVEPTTVEQKKPKKNAAGGDEDYEEPKTVEPKKPKTVEPKKPKKKAAERDEDYEEPETVEPKKPKKRAAQPKEKNEEPKVEPTKKKNNAEPKAAKKAAKKTTENNDEAGESQKDQPEEKMVDETEKGESEATPPKSVGEILRANTADLTDQQEGQKDDDQEKKRKEKEKHEKLKIYKARKGRFYRSLESGGPQRFEQSKLVEFRKQSD